jgi:hypothetical protein
MIARHSRAAALVASMSASLLLAGCASSPPSASEESPTVAQAAKKYPEPCTIAVDEDRDGTVDRYSRKVIDERGRVIQTLEDSTGDGVFDGAMVYVHGPEPDQQWAAHRDRGADGQLDAREGEDIEDDRDWLLKPRLDTLGHRAEDVTDQSGEVVARRGHYSYELIEPGHSETVRTPDGPSRFEEHPARIPVELPATGVRMHDEHDRLVAEWLFVAPSAEAPPPDPEVVGERIHLDEQSRSWRVRAGEERLVSAHLLGYSDDGHLVYEATWEEPGEEGVPTLDSIVDRAGLDEPHDIHRTGGATGAFLPLPDRFEEHMTGLVVRQVDDGGRLTLYTEYRRHERTDHDGPGLALSQYERRAHDADGNTVRRELSGTSRRGNAELSDGIIDGVFVFEITDGEVVEERFEVIGFDPELDVARIPGKWRGVPLAVDASAEPPVEPTVVVTDRITIERDRAGNERERVFHTAEHTYDEDGRLVEKTDLEPTRVIRYGYDCYE